MQRGKYIRTETTLKKMSESHRGQISHWKGKSNPHMQGANNICHRPEVKDKIVEGLKRFRVENPHRMKGEDAPNWKGGTTVKRGIKYDPKYSIFRKKIFERDNYTCTQCGIRGGVELNLDHIKPKALYPELAWEESNVRTLCHPCHRKTETYGVGTWRMKKQLI